MAKTSIETGCLDEGRGIQIMRKIYDQGKDVVQLLYGGYSVVDRHINESLRRADERQFAD